MMFDSKESMSGEISPQDIIEAEAIAGVFLVDELHPLLQHPALAASLNAAAENTWNLEPGSKPTTFEVTTLQDAGL